MAAPPDITASRTAYFRYLYAAELAILALPCLAVLAPFLAGLALFSYGGLIVTIIGMSRGSDFTVEHLAFAAAGSAIVTAAFAAIWIFLDLSIAYLSGCRDWTRRHRRKFWTGLILSILPIIFTFAAAAREIGIGDRHSVVAVYLSGLPLLVPTLHLGLATRLKRMKSTQQKSPADDLPGF